MGLEDRADDRPVYYGDLIAARWFDDPEYKFGKVDDYVPGGITMEAVENADHVVRLMNAGEFSRMIDEMSHEAFDPVISRFPMITTGDFDPGAAAAFDKALENAVMLWLHWNYPKK